MEYKDDIEYSYNHKYFVPVFEHRNGLGGGSSQYIGDLDVAKAAEGTVEGREDENQPMVASKSAFDAFVHQLTKSSFRGKPISLTYVDPVHGAADKDTEEPQFDTFKKFLSGVSKNEPEEIHYDQDNEPLLPKTYIRVKVRKPGASVPSGEENSTSQTEGGNQGQQQRNTPTDLFSEQIRDGEESSLESHTTSHSESAEASADRENGQEQLADNNAAAARNSNVERRSLQRNESTGSASKRKESPGPVLEDSTTTKKARGAVWQAPNLCIINSDSFDEVDAPPTRPPNPVAIKTEPGVTSKELWTKHFFTAMDKTSDPNDVPTYMLDPAVVAEYKMFMEWKQAQAVAREEKEKQDQAKASQSSPGEEQKEPDSGVSNKRQPTQVAQSESSSSQGSAGAEKNQLGKAKSPQASSGTQQNQTKQAPPTQQQNQTSLTAQLGEAKGQINQAPPTQQQNQTSLTAQASAATKPSGKPSAAKKSSAAKKTPNMGLPQSIWQKPYNAWLKRTVEQREKGRANFVRNQAGKARTQKPPLPMVEGAAGPAARGLSTPPASTGAGKTPPSDGGSTGEKVGESVTLGTTSLTSQRQVRLFSPTSSDPNKYSHGSVAKTRYQDLVLPDCFSVKLDDLVQDDKTYFNKLDQTINELRRTSLSEPLQDTGTAIHWTSREELVTGLDFLAKAERYLKDKKTTIESNKVFEEYEYKDSKGNTKTNKPHKCIENLSKHFKGEVSEEDVQKMIRAYVSGAFAYTDNAKTGIAEPLFPESKRLFQILMVHPDKVLSARAKFVQKFGYDERTKVPGKKKKDDEEDEEEVHEEEVGDDNGEGKSCQRWTADTWKTFLQNLATDANFDKNVHPTMMVLPHWLLMDLGMAFSPHARKTFVGNNPNYPGAANARYYADSALYAPARPELKNDQWIDPGAPLVPFWNVRTCFGNKPSSKKELMKDLGFFLWAIKMYTRTNYEIFFPLLEQMVLRGLPFPFAGYDSNEPWDLGMVNYEVYQFALAVKKNDFYRNWAGKKNDGFGTVFSILLEYKHWRQTDCPGQVPSKPEDLNDPKYGHVELSEEEQSATNFECQWFEGGGGLFLRERIAFY